MPSRRTFLGTALATGAAVALPATASAAGHPRRRRVPKESISIQLYTLRSIMGDDPEPVLSALADIGYRKVELAGTYGRQVSLFDGEWSYARGPEGANAPLSMWSNRWSTMPIHHLPDLRLPVPDDRVILLASDGLVRPLEVQAAAELYETRVRNCKSDCLPDVVPLLKDFAEQPRLDYPPFWQAWTRFHAELTKLVNRKLFAIVQDAQQQDGTTDA